MNVTVLSDKRREKQWKFERSVLKNLSLKDLKADVEQHFKPVVPFHFLSHPFLLDPCMDMAIDAFLLGAEYGKFGYLGESEKQVKERCDDDLTEISHCIFNLLQGWLLDSDYLLDSLQIATEAFVEQWWAKGFREGEKRYRLRLH
ncbi:YbaK family protein [Halalkalibacter alkalisediminis]|uniref:YbaK family protein n=1 Tax=Halalkalibacter alkalisediminis TaxID=935616 RepID=A0ABV6NE43_9BACI|nr:YbaK family protein [Halalkalibacter alkalisediminis]